MSRSRQLLLFQCLHVHRCISADAKPALSNTSWTVSTSLSQPLSPSLPLSLLTCLYSLQYVVAMGDALYDEVLVHGVRVRWICLHNSLHK